MRQIVRHLTYNACLKLVLQPAVRVLRAVYGQVLKKLYGTRTLNARHTRDTRTSHARVSARRLPVRAPQEKMCMHIFCCGRSTIIESQVVRREHARSPHGTRACPVRERLEGYVLCGAAAIRILFKSYGALTGGRPYGRL